MGYDARNVGRLRFTHVTAVAAAVSACSLTTSLSDLSNGHDSAPAEDAGGDATTTVHDDGGSLPEASTGPDADAPTTDAEIPAGSVISTNGDFRDGCKGWSAYLSTSTAKPAGRSGGACELCFTGDVHEGFSLFQRWDDTPKVGARYHAVGWARATTQTGQTVQATLRVFDDHAGFKQIQGSGGESTTLSTTAWTRIAVDLTVKTPGPSTQFYVYVLPAEAGQCVLLDDVYVTRE